MICPDYKIEIKIEVKIYKVMAETVVP